MNRLFAIVLRLLPALCFALLTLAPAQAALNLPARAQQQAEVKPPCHEEAAGKPAPASERKPGCCGEGAGDCAAQCASQCAKLTPLGLVFGLHPQRPVCQPTLLSERFDSATLPLPERPPRLI